MLKRLPNGNIEISVRPPLVYLDHWAVREISSNPAWRAHLLETFRTRGTLMFSLVNILEMGRNSGKSYADIRALLDDLEPYWVISDLDPRTAQAREDRGILPPASFLAPVELLGILFKNMPAATFRLGSALEGLQDDNFREQATSLLEPWDVIEHFEQARSRYRRGEAMVSPPAPRFRPMWIHASLLQLLIKDGKAIKSNDVIDILHAVVPLAYAVVVLLDKAWVSFSTRLGLPDTKIFARPQLDDALEAIRTIDVSRHRIVRGLGDGIGLAG
jgi:hypothetical protein